MTDSKIKQTGLIARMTEKALANQPASAAEVIELGNLMNINSQKAEKRHNELVSRLSYLEERFCPVLVSSNPTQAEAENDGNFNCKDCTINKTNQVYDAISAILFVNSLQSISRPFMGYPTIMSIKV